MATTKVPTIKDEIFRQELDALYRENFDRCTGPQNVLPETGMMPMKRSRRFS